MKKGPKSAPKFFNDSFQFLARPCVFQPLLCIRKPLCTAVFRLLAGSCTQNSRPFHIFSLFMKTHNESFAKATGTNAGLYNTLIALLTALMIVLGMRMMGALLITSLIVFPALTSMRLCKKFKAVIINSAIISVICLWAGLTFSYVYATPTGASIVLCNIIVFFLYWVIQTVKGVIGRA